MKNVSIVEKKHQEMMGKWKPQKTSKNVIFFKLNPDSRLTELVRALNAFNWLFLCRK